MEPPAYFPLLCKKALRVALSLHKKQPQADLARCRHTNHLHAWKYLWHFINDPVLVTMKLLLIGIFFFLSKCVHSLIKLSLPNGVTEVEAHVLKELWDYYEEAVSIIAAAVSQRQSHITIPWLPPPVSSNRRSPCYIINPLSSTPCLPAVLEASFYQWAFSCTSISRCFHSPIPFLPIWILMCCTSHHTAGDLKLWKRHQITETLHCFTPSAYFPFHIGLLLKSRGILWIKVKAQD